MMTTATAPAAETRLARFQDDFMRALLATEDAAPDALKTLTAQPAFAIYRNTVIKGCIDAVQANYPAVTRIVGEEWLRAAAAIYAREALPDQPMLLLYGSDFSRFLETFEPAAELPYLSGVARLDRFWTEAHVAASEPTLNPATITQLPPEDLLHARLQPHAATRWAWFADAPIHTIWSRNRGNAVIDGDITWQAEGALLTRPQDSVQWCALDHAGCAFLNACAAAGTVADAMRAALEAQADADPARLIASLLEAGAFSRLVPDT